MCAQNIYFISIFSLKPLHNGISIPETCRGTLGLGRLGGGGGQSGPGRDAIAIFEAKSLSNITTIHFMHSQYIMFTKFNALKVWYQLVIRHLLIKF